MLPDSEYIPAGSRADAHRHDMYELYSKARSWNDLSQSHLNLADLLMEEGLCKASLIVAHMAVKAKLKQVFLQSEGMLPPEDLGYDELIGRTREFAEIDLETELFLTTLQYIAETENAAFLPRIESGHLEKMIARIKNVLSWLDVYAFSTAGAMRLDN
ncbi:hypothetical protein [Paenibacillus chibensis]|uniref:hypothetical protein n=1 Tax=Paenibacillus chibensis TaxID=59846 RepID=UPI000FDC3951|nr:hypothetical protein [Paenibacillus chibensis]MEC0372997.1 hypothetical protein [Paenibacillus chibensis]